MQTILAIDDELSVRESYRITLQEHYKVLLAEGASQALAMLEKQYVDLILLDLTMPGMSGLDFLNTLQERGESTPVIVVTASNSVEMAVKVLKCGAHDFVIKPFDIEELRRLVKRILEDFSEKRELTALREQGAAGFENIVGDSPALMQALTKATRAMEVDSTVLITGQTGTGKDVLARSIHYGSIRKKGPYVPISCCAIPNNLVESELFGHVKGAFTGATENRIGKMKVADGGTLFLDEIGEMPLEAQSRLLRVLQDNCFYAVGGSKLIQIDTRFICATNRNFAQAIKDGFFREDLFYRINVLPIEMPPLVKRREDIPKLVAHFIAKHGPRVNSRISECAPRAMARLTSYSWPGNVRELENAVERLLVCYGNETIIRPEYLDGILPSEAPAQISYLDEFNGLPLQEATRRLEHHLIRRALERCDYVQSQAAQLLGTTRRILKYKMDQLEISDHPDESEAKDTRLAM